MILNPSTCSTTAMAKKLYSGSSASSSPKSLNGVNSACNAATPPACLAADRRTLRADPGGQSDRDSLIRSSGVAGGIEAAVVGSRRRVGVDGIMGGGAAGLATATVGTGKVEEDVEELNRCIRCEIRLGILRLILDGTAAVSTAAAIGAAVGRAADLAAGAINGEEASTMVVMLPMSTTTGALRVRDSVGNDAGECVDDKPRSRVPNASSVAILRLRTASMATGLLGALLGALLGGVPPSNNGSSLIMDVVDDVAENKGTPTPPSTPMAENETERASAGRLADGESTSIGSTAPGTVVTTVSRFAPPRSSSSLLERS
ncbi:hypothetical protein BC828DRAFT_384118 [Blastocladiella britannica]|nr:hypothetical protein BC828DRAFT_384118 [Blastocladiella britannica]